MSNVYYRGRGEVSVAPYDGSAGLRMIGNCKEVKFSMEENKTSLPDYMNAGGGKLASSSVITGVMISIVMNDRTAKNLALAMRGSATAVAAGSATDEAHKGYHGDEIVMDTHITPTSIVVKDSSGTTTYTLDTDYTVDEKGKITILPTGTIADGEDLKISYSYAAHNQVAALTQAAQEYKFVFVGLNDENGKPVVVTAHKVKFDPAKEMNLISENYDEMPLTAEVLADKTRIGAGQSQHWTALQAEV
ncbi:MAG: hypothetical protein OEZ32_04330 [Nitrospinota bacterium]|nr:hypothetical protein [Nitrospinota bacterium]